MKVNQIFEIVNSVANQMSGFEDIQVTDLSTLINLGSKITNSTDFTDEYLKKLVDRIFKTIVNVRPYSRTVKDMIIDSTEFGCVLQKIYVKPMEAQKSSTWDQVDGGTVDQYKIEKPVVEQKLFNGINTWEVRTTIPMVQVKSAFMSVEGMGAFIDAIFVALATSMELRLESMVNMTYNNFIASRIVHTKVNGGHTVIDLLGDYKALTGNTTLTAAKAMFDLGFLTYATTQINLYIKRFEVLSTLFNEEDYLRHTPREYARVTMLADFVANVTSTLRANTFHEELVNLPQYSEVVFWQGSGEQWSFDNSSSINLISSNGYEVAQSGIIGMITDYEALGVMINNKRLVSAENTIGEYVNYASKADMGYFNDLSENGIVFVVADTINTPVKRP